MAIISIRTHHDDLLGVFAPLAVAAVRPRVLVVDLQGDGIPLPGGSTLAELVGGDASEVRPHRAGVACLPNGGIALDDAVDTVRELCQWWPDVVVRGPEVLGSTAIDVVPDVNVVQPPSPNTLWVRAQLPIRLPSVPAPSRAALLAVLEGRLPPGRRRARWSVAWEHPWR